MKLTVYRDNTPTFQAQVFNADGTPVDLTGCTILCCYKANQDLPNTLSLIEKDNASIGGIAMNDPGNGIFQMKWQTADTQSFTDTVVGSLDFLLTDSNGNVFTVANNTVVEVKANYSRVSNV
jgi:hypothetical protein